MKKYGEPYQLKDVKAGIIVLFNGTKHKVLSNNGYILTLQNLENDNIIKTNQRQFDRYVQINSETTNMNLKEEIKKIIREEIKKIPKIKYTPLTKKSYETSSEPIVFELEINGKKATGYWSIAMFGSINNGVDINELKTADGRWISIFDGGGMHRSYEIFAKLPRAAKQPKDLRFTGETLDVSPLKKVFVEKIQKALSGELKVPLHKNFLEYFNLA